MVTGANGFLGKTIISYLINYNDINVIALTSNPSSLNATFKGEILCWDLDMLNNPNLPKIYSIINCAFARNNNPNELISSINFTSLILDFSIKKKIKKFINISSQSVYSQSKKFIPSEEHNLLPDSIYGFAKIFQEMITDSFLKETSIKYSNIRLGSLIGKNFNSRLINIFIKKAFNGEIVSINKNNQFLSFLDVRDAAEGIIKFLFTNSNYWKKIYNNGSPETFTLTEIVTKLNHSLKLLNKKPLRYNMVNNKNTFNNTLNSNDFYSITKWKPKYNLQLLIKEYIEEFYDNKINLI